MESFELLYSNTKNELESQFTIVQQISFLFMFFVCIHSWVTNNFCFGDLQNCRVRYFRHFSMLLTLPEKEEGSKHVSY